MDTTMNNTMSEKMVETTLQPETQRSRFRTHRERLFRREKKPVATFVTNLRVFFADCWLDVLTIVIIIATAAGVWVAPHTFTRLFPITFFTDGAVVYPQFAYPYVKSIFSPAGAGLIAGFVPLACILIAQLWLRSFFDAGNAILGLAYSLSAGVLFQVVIKKTIGGLRPHFLSVCEPVIPEGLVGVGFQNLMFTAEQVCTGDPDRIKNALESFPSGHAQIAWSGMGYLAIYLFTHFQIQSRTRRPSHYKMMFTLAPLLLATYLTSTLVLGYHHHGYDVIMGTIIGLVTAFFGYRMVFMSVHDLRFNTVPSRRWEHEKREEIKQREDLEQGRRFSGVTAVGEGTATARRV